MQNPPSLNRIPRGVRLVSKKRAGSNPGPLSPANLTSPTLTSTCPAAATGVTTALRATAVGVLHLDLHTGFDTPHLNLALQLCNVENDPPLSLEEVCALLDASVPLGFTM
jgi:hypothetical protein